MLGPIEQGGVMMRRAAGLVAVTAVAASVLLVSGNRLVREVSERDSISYWAAGRLLLRHENPYDGTRVLQLENEEGYREDVPLLLRTPPWSLFLVIPLGISNAFWAWTAWTAGSIALLIVAIRLISRTLMIPGRLRRIPLFVSYLFAPVAACLVSGQMGIVLLLGAVLFACFERERPFRAGASLLLMAVKPHLFIPFWTVLMLWVLARRRYAVAVGLATAAGAAVVLALLFDPYVLRHYRDMLQGSGVDNEFHPVPSGMIRLLFFRNMFWVQFVPVAIGILWCARYFVAHRHVWDWRDHGPVLLLACMLTRPYGWLSDEVVVLPAILQAAVRVFDRPERANWRSTGTLTMFGALNGVLLLALLSRVPLGAPVYFWSSIVWVAWYRYSRPVTVDQGSHTSTGSHMPWALPPAEANK
jgi:hypothetical protein